MVDVDIDSAPDLISNLPVNVVENILMFLPLRDAVRTSVLSKKWCQSWETLPRLVFDAGFEDSLKQSQSQPKNELLTTVYQILLLRRSPVLEFILSISGSENFPNIDPMVKFLSRSGIRKFTLSIKRAKNYEAPLRLFSCLQLTHLELLSCLFKPPATFQGFNRLTTVTFQNVYFDTDFREFMLKCASLENLTMLNCRNVDCLDIDAPNLKVISVGVLFKSIYFRKTPLLSRASIRGYGSEIPVAKNGNATDMAEVFACLPRLKYLNVGFYLLMILASGDIPERLPTRFNHLETLVLHGILLDKVAEVSCALCLMKSSPFLRILEIDLDEQEIINPNEALEFLEIHNRSDVRFNHLQEIKMLSFTGSRSQMGFVKLILAKSPMLERMNVHASMNLSISAELHLLTQIARFCRASALAEVIFSGVHNK